MEKRWVFRPVPAAEKIEELSKAININAVLASILIQRNIASFDEAKAFFRPALSDLHDPFLMKDMDKAADRLIHAMQSGEKILIYGDYDVDGTTSVALVFDFLSKRYSNIDFYIPDRYKEGYGVSAASIEWAKQHGFGLVICLDCGIKSVELIGKAADYGIDFIVCDHHKAGDELPPACAVLDPKRKDCAYPYKELSGCGVGFKLLQAYCLRKEISMESLYSYLDLVAISIASDIVPITGENRILTYYGLKVINENPRPGVKALIGVAGIKKDLDVSNIVFGLGPRINAAGRIAHAKTAVSLLISKTEEEADLFAAQINEKNLVRKDFDITITEEALKMIEDDGRNAVSTVLFKEDWHKGVIGIVASRCIEKYYRPTIILTKNDQMATGSARSVAGFDVYDAISKCSDLLIQFGGHMYAAGLTMKVDNVLAFRKKFEEVVAASIRQDQLVPQVEVDMEIPLSRIDYRLYNILKQMAPFGPGNMQPVFVTKYVRDNGNIRVLKEQHLKMTLTQDGAHPVEAIAFGMAGHFAKICEKKVFHICYNICENEFNGRKSLQLLIKDIKYDD